MADELDTVGRWSSADRSASRQPDPTGWAPWGHAFADDPMMCWTLRNARRSPDRFTPLFATFLEQVLGHGLVWEAGPARGAAVWIPPGRFEEWTEQPWNHPHILELADDGGRRYDAFWRWVDRHGPKEPRWLRDSIAVDPAARAVATVRP